MSKDIIKDPLTITQVSSMGGKKRAQSLSAERRKEIAIKASYSRNCLNQMPKATHQGKIIIGDISLDCAVLDNGKRVITESSAFKVIGRQRKGRKKKHYVSNERKKLKTNVSKMKSV